MSIAPRPIPSDWYHLDTLTAAQHVQKWFAGEKGSTDFALDQLFRVLEVMKYETPFEGGRRDSSDSFRMLSRGDPFKHRRPVWELIATAIEPHTTAPSSKKAKAEWLQEQLKVCSRHIEYTQLLADFETQVAKLGLSFSSERPGADVVVTGTFLHRGREARENVEKIVDALIPALEQYIKGL